ncbi:MAG: hypothetical protein NTW20_04155 [Rhodobacterales bacterium]|nr:hypothetical protein [Rhodobacterales bacterium]
MTSPSASRIDLPTIRTAIKQAHRSGIPAPIASDPELDAFIRARTGQMTFARIVAEVAAAFPPHRRKSMSALSRWWKSNRQTPPKPG